MDLVGIVLLTLFGTILILAVLIIAWFYSTFNALKRLEGTIKDAYSNLNQSILARNTILPKILLSVKSHATVEEFDFESLEIAIDLSTASQNITEQIKNETYLQDKICLFQDFIEHRNNIQNDPEFITLKTQYEKINNEITYSRTIYNKTSQIYNNKIKKFPSTLLARYKNFTPKPYFENKE